MLTQHIRLVGVQTSNLVVCSSLWPWLTMFTSNMGHCLGAEDMVSARKRQVSGGGPQVLDPSWAAFLVPASELAFMKKPDGSDWELGSGAFGTVRRSTCVPCLHIK